MAGSLTLEQWIALNDEIAAMVRAGLPLDRYLMGLGRGRLGEVSRTIAARLERGEGLEEALAAEGEHVPPIYGAVVRAGLRSGRLSSALEGIAAYARNYLEMRRVAGLALIYPLLVMLLAYVLFVGFLLFVLPPFLSTFDLFRFDARRVLGGLEALRGTAIYWVPVFPCLLLAGVLWWAWSGRARAFPRVGTSPLGWIPGMRGVMNQFAAAGFAELLALLIEHETPLPEAIEMAAGATGDRRLTESARVAAAALNNGRPLPENRREAEGIPALLRWLIAYGSRQGRLAASLRHAAEMYRRRAYLRADLIRTFLPTATMLVVGATVTLLYAMTLFLPFSSLLERIATDL